MKKICCINFQYIFILSLFVLILAVSNTGCNKEEPTVIIPSDLPPKQISLITQDGNLLYEFNYLDGQLDEYIFYGEPYSRTVFQNGKIYRRYDDSGKYLEYEHKWNWIYVYSSLDPDTRLESYEYGWDDKLKSVTIHQVSTDDIKYSYQYIRNNLKKIIITQGTGEDKLVKTFYLTFDKSPNPWYGLGIIDDFAALSENNYMEINSYPWATYEYDEQGYMIQSDIYEQGICQYHYK